MKIPKLAKSTIETIRGFNATVSNREIGRQLHISESVVRKYRPVEKEAGQEKPVLNPDNPWAKDLVPGGRSSVTLSDRGDGWSVLGFVSDTHLGSKHERLDALNSLYDIFAGEGVKDVYHGGNWIEGEARFNRHDIKIFGLENQVNYFVANYPERQGIVTHYVAGDDHEGWYVQREQIDIGKHLERTAKDAGREDLHYLGYVEADVELRAPGTEKSAVLRVMHGGGGSAYATSYTLQKLVESYQGGEKPDLLAVGHYHKFVYGYWRNVHAFEPGCVEDQSIFMRKQKIEAHVGGVLAWVKQNPQDGHIERCRIEFIPYFDRGFYEKRFAVGLSEHQAAAA